MKRNLAANLAGMGWALLLQILATPLYIRLLGAEAYGLIGFHTLAMGLLQVLDAGITPAVNYQAARLGAGETEAAKLGTLARTLTACGWCLGLVASLGIIACNGLMVNHWLHIQSLPPDQVRISLVLLGVVGGLQLASIWPTGVIMGLERQVGLSILNMATSTTSHAIALLTIWRFHTSIVAYFVCQVGAAMVTAISLLWLLHQALPPEARENRRISFEVLVPMITYARDMGLVALCSVILTQLDKVILSRFLGLGEFGFYALASNVAGQVRQLAIPVFNACLPRMSASIRLGHWSELASVFWKATRVIALLTAPAAVVLMLDPQSVLRIWTGNSAIAHGAALPLRILLVGALLNALLHMPYALQLASGWTSLIRQTSLLSVVVMVPSLFWATSRFGMLGAASCWAGLNILTLFILVPIVHRRLLPGCAWRWIGVVLMSLAMTTVISGLVLIKIPSDPDHPGLSRLAVAWVLSGLVLWLWRGRPLMPNGQRRDTHAS
jgi:O-antigen/teichoic acid export membrane protein